MDVNSSLPKCSSQYLIVFGYVTNLGIVHAAQYRINCGHSLLKDKEAYATHLGSNPILEGSKILISDMPEYVLTLCVDLLDSYDIQRKNLSLKLFKEAAKRPLYLLSLYSYRRSLGVSCLITPFSFEETSTLLVQAPELITASILAGTPAADGLVAGVTATLNNGDPSASPNCS